jgi:hypothetical protein
MNDEELPRMVTKVPRRALTGMVIATLLLPGIVAAAELEAAELQGTANDVIIDRGSSATFVISVSVSGLAECYTSYAATVDTEFSIDEAGMVSASSPSAPLAFFTAIPPTPRVSCPVAWNQSPTPHMVSATVTTTATTPLGDYTITLSEAAGTTTTTMTDGEITAGGAELEDAFATTITVHVLDELRDKVAPTNASIWVDSNSGWVGDPTLSLDLAANDNIGISRYRLARSQADLSSAADVPVSPAAAVFTAADVSWPLGEFALDGFHAVWVRYFDAEGNFTDARSGASLDRTKPMIFASTGSYTPGSWTDQDVTVTFTCQDMPSIDPILGIVLAQPGEIAEWAVEIVTLTTSGADQSVTSTTVCRDQAGNVADPLTVGDIDINKGYTGISGILQPINPDNTSVFGRGKSVPVKFQLGGDEPAGFDTSAWTLRKQQVSCSSFDAIGAEVEPVAENPSNAFRYDVAADQYIYNASFKGAAAGTCWRVVVALDTGQTLTSATFRLQS